MALSGMFPSLRIRPRDPEKVDPLLPRDYVFELDGHELRGIRSLRLDFDTGDPTTATLAIMVSDVEVDEKALIELQAIVDTRKREDAAGE